MAHYTRYVWDGYQVLHEVRSPDESDHPQDSPSSAAYGRVGYTHGGVIDAPLDLIRIGHAGDAATVIVPLRNALGQHDRGSIVAGPGVSINWPGAQWNAFRKPLDPYPKPGGWAGGLITGSADQWGLQYMRNRYYDPRTGQFTQQDPATGSIVGGILALCLHTWRTVATGLFGIAAEGVAFNTYAIAHILGFPMNVLVSLIVDYVPLKGGVSASMEYLLLLLGIVGNWAILAYLRAAVVRRKV